MLKVLKKGVVFNWLMVRYAKTAMNDQELWSLKGLKAVSLPNQQE